MQEERPLILDRYRPLETRAKGGFSTVEIAWDTRIQRRVAIKSIPLEDPSPAGAPGLTEARTAAMLSHPSIVSVFDFEWDDENAYLIMECIDGGTLDDVLDFDEGILGLDEMATVVTSIANALEFAHENRILHLDIKPANVLVNQNGHVKVADFGMSQLASLTGYEAAAGGTIGYMPPEQICGETLDERTDEWAFASLVYEMLTGENPFLVTRPNLSQDEQLEESFQRIEDVGREELAPPSVFRNDIDADIDDVVLRALSPQKEDRFDSIEDFVDELMPFLGDPREGRLVLRALLSDECDEEEEDTKRTGLWERLGKQGQGILSRMLTMAASGWITWLALCMNELEIAAVIAGTIAVMMVAVFVPTLSAILGVICLGVSIIFTGNALVGAITLVGGLAWWLFFGRRSTKDIALPFTSLLTGILHITPAFPLLCGFFLPVRRALPAAVFGGLLMIVLSACTGFSGITSCGVAYYAPAGILMRFSLIVSDPATWIVFAGWIIGAVCMSALCSSDSRVLSFVGTALATSISFAASIIAQWSTTQSWAFVNFETGLAFILALALVIVITILGAPYHGETRIKGV